MIQDLTPVQEEVFNRLDALAAKLGIASEHLWGVLQQQSIMRGLWDFSANFVFIVISGGILLSVKSKEWSYKTEYNNTDITKYGVTALLSGIGLLVTLVVLGANGSYWITEVFNSEWYAWKEIKSILK